MVVGAQRLTAADGNRFLTDVQVQEAADLALGVQLSGFFLESPNQHHLVVEIEQIAFG